MLTEELSALVLTCNERENVGRMLERLLWLRAVVIVDSFSTDGTSDIAKSAHPGVTVVQRQFDTFAQQCNFGLSLIKTEWVLSCDADYLCSNELAAELAALVAGKNTVGFRAEFRYCVHGHPLRSTIYPARTVLYRRSAAAYVDDGHGHRVRVNGFVASLRAKIDHDDRKPLSRWLQSQDRYMVIEARHLLVTPAAVLSKQDWLRRETSFAPVVMLLYLLFGRGLILDGWHGWYYVYQRVLAEALLRLRLLTERERLEDSEGGMYRK